MLTKATGNMYPWVTHCHAFLRGECPHQCRYCYARLPFRGHPSRQVGPLRLDRCELLEVSYPAKAVVLMEHKNDLWAGSVPDDWKAEVVRHCSLRRIGSPELRFVFQSKNSAGLWSFESEIDDRDILGTTIETNRDIPPEISRAPQPVERGMVMMNMAGTRQLFVTVEPVMAFDELPFRSLLSAIRPTWINIGADSKGCRLPEPSEEDLEVLICGLRQEGIEVRLKDNLLRLMPHSWQALKKGGMA